VCVNRNALLRIKRHAGLATLAESDGVTLARAKMVVGHQHLSGFALATRKRKPVLHLHQQEPSARERVVKRMQREPAYDFAYPHTASSSICCCTCGPACFEPFAKRESRFF